MPVRSPGDKAAAHAIAPGHGSEDIDGRGFGGLGRGFPCVPDQERPGRGPKFVLDRPEERAVLSRP